jgi:tripartite-type tricarboxylate transporter receptor subunit TctC
MARVLSILTLVAAAILSPVTAFAETWPTRPVRIIVPFPPGGGADAIARIIQEPLSVLIGQPVVIENRAGAAGLVGTEAVVRAAPDGYTIGIVISSLAAASALGQKLGFDPTRDPTPITLIGQAPNVIVVHPSVSAKTLAELIALGKTSSLNYGSGGIGSSHHFGGELLRLISGAKFEHTPYRGGGPLINDLIGGQIPTAFTTIQSIAPHIAAGRVRALAVTGPNRSPLLPDVPTVAEAVGQPFDVVDWWGIIGPLGLKAELRDRINGALVQVIGSHAVRERLIGLGMTITPTTPEAFADLIRSDVDKLREIARRAAMKAE